ncbi:hypothetical protein WR25_05127 [Diploscapter pachys]|uniref:Uncharacterized protein n=1 Tax=Diploscapter pachys TaxID=2018661 RepID=A0A2A2KIN7_9BILA|nr:hypothetical protein WR25_05127 [Diploscapter pachys]
MPTQVIATNMRESIVTKSMELLERTCIPEITIKKTVMVSTSINCPVTTAMENMNTTMDTSTNRINRIRRT